MSAINSVRRTHHIHNVFINIYFFVVFFSLVANWRRIFARSTFIFDKWCRRCWCPLWRTEWKKKSTTTININFMSISACLFGWFIESNYWHIIERSETDKKKHNKMFSYFIILLYICKYLMEYTQVRNKIMNNSFSAKIVITFITNGILPYAIE